MTIRTIQRTIRFLHPFRLSGMDTTRPAGVYTVETDEELLQELSFPAHRRIATRLVLPGTPSGSILEEVVEIDPSELEAALETDSDGEPVKRGANAAGAEDG